MLDKLKEKLKTKQGKQKLQISKKGAIIGGTAVFAMATMMSILGYSPGGIISPAQEQQDKKVSIPELSKSAGAKQTIAIRDDNKFPRKVLNKQINPSLAPSLPIATTPVGDGLFNKLPTTMPNMSGKPALPTSGQSIPVDADASQVYARHVSITDNMRNSVSSLFSLDKMSEAPDGSSSSGRFLTSFSIKDYAGNPTERFELMSIVRTKNMSSLKTATDAFKALVEEADSVNIIESDDSYLIYDYAGSKGYQIGKISLDDKGIYIVGYINLTTNDMPFVLKAEWIERFKNL